MEELLAAMKARKEELEKPRYRFKNVAQGNYWMGHRNELTKWIEVIELELNKDVPALRE